MQERSERLGGTMNIIMNERSRAWTSYWRCLPLLLVLTGLTTLLRAQTATTAFNFTLAASPASAAVLQGQGINYVVTAASITGGDNVNLTVSGLPAGASATFSTNPLVVPAGSSGLSGMFVTADNSTPAGSYILTIAGTSVSTGLSKSTTVTWIVQEATTTVLSASALFQPVGQPVTLTATVSAPSGGTPIGFIYFRDSGVLLARVPLSGGVATFTTSTLVGGDHSLDAHYGGNVKFATSTSPVLSLFFFGKPTDTALAFNPHVPTFGEPLTITATVSGAGPIPTGTVIFKDRTRTLGTGVLDGAGTAQITTSATELEGGSQHVMTAIYSADLVYESNIKSVPLTVNPAASTTVLSSSLNPAPAGTEVTLTATVSGPGTPLGFIYFRDSGALLARVPLTGGVATFRARLPDGTHSLDAHYGGNLSWNTSTSAVLEQVVNGPRSGFVYVASSPGVSGYAVDASAGFLTPVVGSPFLSLGEPTGLAATPAGQFLYVASRDANSVLAYAIDGAGGLTPVSGSPFPIPGGISPRAVTVDPTGHLAYVANGNSNNISAFTIDAGTGALTPLSGSPFPSAPHPASIAVTPAGRFAYVANLDPGDGLVSGYTIDSATGALTPLAGSPFPTGGAPFSITVDPTGRFAYVANGSNVLAYTIDGTTGALTPAPGSPYPQQAISITVDPKGQFVYVTDDELANTAVVGYTIDAATGALTQLAGSPFPTGTGPLSIAVDPTGQFVYVVNTGINSVSAYAINRSSGVLTPVAGSPFATEFGSRAVITTTGPTPSVP
jgi:6-phosphogluconolactonase (cycloisomerase 2 family)